MKHIRLQGKGIRKTFPAEKEQVQVLDGIDVEVYDGDFTIIMGSSGAGKSTLLYALSGMDRITEGMVAYEGREINGLSEAEMAKLRAEEFGFVFQQTHLVSNLTLFENVAVAGYVSRKEKPDQIRRRTEELLGQMGVGDAKNRLPSQVSGGEAQRAAIARAMIGKPGMLFADEPTGALNRANTEAILDLLTELNNNGQSILMVTHDMRAAARGNRILYLEDGRILAELSLNPYQKTEEKDREAQVNAWLSNMSW